MKKTLLAIGLATSLFGFDVNKLYVGLGATYGKGTYDIKYNNTTESYNYTTTSMPLKIGYEFKSRNRFEVIIQRANIDDIYGEERKWRSVSFDYNWVFKNNIYAGVNYAIYSYEDTAQYISNSNDDLSGDGFGLKVGYLKSINKNLEFDTNIQSSYIKWDNLWNILTGVQTREASQLNLYVGLNYHF